MGDTNIIITPQLLAIVGGDLGLLATVSVAVARAFLKRMDQSEERFEKLEALIKQSEERSEKRSEKLEALIKQSDERSEKRSENQEADNQQRHSETQTELRELNSRVGRLETPGVHDRSAGRSESQSPRRDHDSATAPEGESDPPPVAKHFKQSMVPPAGGRSETQHSAGLARQAVPDEQQVGETDSEPSEEASPDASR